MKAYRNKRIIIGLALTLCFNGSALADKLDTVVKQTVATNPELLMQAARRFAQNSALREAISGYFPSVDIIANYGRDHNENFFTRLENTSTGELTLTKREAGMSIRQMLFDGFAVRSMVEADTAKVQSASYNVLATMEDVIVQVAASYVDTIMLRSIFMHAKENTLYHQDLVDQLVNATVDNDQNTDQNNDESTAQTTNKKTVVKDGDINLSRSRLSGAHTSMLDIQRQVRDAQADYIKVVGQKPGVMYRPESPEQIIPNSEEAAVAVAISNNPRVFEANADIRVARAEKCYAKSNYYPRLDLELAGTNNKNVDGYNQNTNSLSAMVWLRYNLFRGGKDVANEQKSSWMVEATKEGLSEVTRTVEQNMRHVWSAYVNYKGKLGFLKDRVETLQKTRDTYRKEYFDGQRDVLDVLDATDELFIAKVEFIRAQYRELLSRFMILHGMGKGHNYFHVSTAGAQPCKPSKWFGS